MESQGKAQQHIMTSPSNDARQDVPSSPLIVNCVADLEKTIKTLTIEKEAAAKRVTELTASKEARDTQLGLCLAAGQKWKAAYHSKAKKLKQLQTEHDILEQKYQALKMGSAEIQPPQIVLSTEKSLETVSKTNSGSSASTTFSGGSGLEGGGVSVPKFNVSLFPDCTESREDQFRNYMENFSRLIMGKLPKCTRKRREEIQDLMDTCLALVEEIEEDPIDTLKSPLELTEQVISTPHPPALGLPELLEAIQAKRVDISKLQKQPKTKGGLKDKFMEKKKQREGEASK